MQHNKPLRKLTISRLGREWHHPPIDDWVYRTLYEIDQMSAPLHYRETASPEPAIRAKYSDLIGSLYPRMKTDVFAPREWTEQPYAAVCDVVKDYIDKNWGRLTRDEREYLFIAIAFGEAKAAVSRRDTVATTELTNRARKMLLRFVKDGGPEKIREISRI